jgi:hypothetical protein
MNLLFHAPVSWIMIMMVVLIVIYGIDKKMSAKQILAGLTYFFVVLTLATILTVFVVMPMLPK